ncbi:MAG TPA: cyclic nucleotide-binding domain-containing protein [Thermoleophilaceae bacterium]
MNVDVLKSVPFFKGLGRRDFKELAGHTDELDVRAGTVLCREGDFGHEFFVIESGEFEVAKADGRTATLGPNDFFGEIALLEADRRNATVTAKTDGTVIVMNRSDFRHLEHDHPEISARVREAIEQRRVPA